MFQEFLNHLKQLEICVLGDLILDEEYQVKVNRLNPEYPIPVYSSENDHPTATHLGGAMNVARQCYNLNAKTFLISVIDQYQECVYPELRGINCKYSLPYSSYLPTKKRVYAGNFPVYRWDVERPFYGLGEDKLKDVIKTIPDADAYIFCDYDKGVFSNLDFSRFKDKLTIVDPKKDIDKWQGCTVFKPNSKEAKELSGETEWQKQCLYFKNRLNCETVIITQGGCGVVGLNKDFFQYIPSNISNSSSVVGGGDVFAAMFTMCIAKGFSIEESAKLAYELGAIYVSRGRNQLVTIDEMLTKTIKSPESKIIDDVKDLKLSINEKIVFTNGCFDLLHYGHIKSLYFAKQFGEKLIIGVNSDESVKKLKGDTRPIIPLRERMLMLASIEVVDYVISFDELTPGNLIKKIKPDTIIKGEQYKNKEVVGNEISNIEICNNYENLSTTKIIEKCQKMKEKI